MALRFKDLIGYVYVCIRSKTTNQKAARGFLTALLWFVGAVTRAKARDQFIYHNLQGAVIDETRCAMPVVPIKERL